jgi:hypothetical protein
MGPNGYTLARSLQSGSQLQGAWSVRESCERYYWNRGGVDSRKLVQASFTGLSRAVVAVTIANHAVGAVRLALAELAAQNKFECIGLTYTSGQAYALVLVPDPVPPELLASLLALSGVLEIEPDRDRTAHYYGFKPQISTRFDSICNPVVPKPIARVFESVLEDQEVLRAMHLPRVRRVPLRKPYVIAMIDDGIEWDHYYLGGHLWRNPRELTGDPGKDDDANGYANDIIGWNFHADSADPTPSCGRSHGTKGAGLIAAIANAADIDVRIMTLRTHGAGSRLALPELTRAVDYASSNGARTIMMAQLWTISGLDKYEQQHTPAFREALKRAGDRGALIVCPAGNDRENIEADHYEPASSGIRQGNVLTVQGFGRNFTTSGGAGAHADRLIVAPGGDNILTVDSEDRIAARFHMTSAATAIVAGLSAVVATYSNIGAPVELKRRLLKCRNKNATNPADLEARLIDLCYLT